MNNNIFVGWIVSRTAITFGQTLVALAFVCFLSGCEQRPGAVSPMATPAPSPEEPRSESALFDTRAIVGAVIDESVVRTILRVDAAAARSEISVPTLGEAFQKAHALLAAGQAVKIQIAPGIYREAVADLDWMAATVRDTALVVEGQGEVTWTGADVFPVEGWTDEGNGLYSHPWTHRFGNSTQPWGPDKSVLAHRSELLFMGDRPLRQRLLETYDAKGFANFGGSKVAWTYTGLRDAAKTLKPGEFGVIERTENKPRILIRLPADATLASAPIEVAVRQSLINFQGKKNLVLRGITFTRTANPLRGQGADGPVSFSPTKGSRPENVLIEDCRFLWNSSNGLKIFGSRFTLRKTESSYNGFSGISSGEIENVIFEDTTTNFNNWRGYWGGEVQWFVGGVKMHNTTGQIVRRHTSIGNLAAGFWHDIHCTNILMEDITAVENCYQIVWELSQGPFHGRRIVAAGGKMGTGSGMRWWNVGQSLLEDSILYADNTGDPRIAVASVRWNPRNDEHAQQKPLEMISNEFRRNVIVTAGGVPNIFHVIDATGMTGDWQPKTLKYVGISNIFEGPAKTMGALLGTVAWPKPGQETQTNSISLAEWVKRNEQSPQVVEGALVNPTQGDYRLSTGIGDSAVFPSVTLSPRQQSAMQEFFDWAGYAKRGWPTFQYD
jgi:hypothetical protein